MVKLQPLRRLQNKIDRFDVAVDARPDNKGSLITRARVLGARTLYLICIIIPNRGPAIGAIDYFYYFSVLQAKTMRPTAEA